MLYFEGDKSVSENGDSLSNFPSANRFLTQLEASSTIEENETFSGEISNGLISECLFELIRAWYLAFCPLLFYSENLSTVNFDL